MARFICLHNGVFNQFSTIVDKMMFDKGITEEELIADIRREHGESGVAALSLRLERAYATGSSEMGIIPNPLESYYRTMVLCHGIKVSYQNWLQKYFTLEVANG